MFGNILLLIVSICTFVSYFPQTILLIKTKDSKNLSIDSWILWVISSGSYVLYAIFVSKSIMMIYETGLEFMFCIIILCLVFIYRKKGDKDE